jgi:hypothetical protein
MNELKEFLKTISKGKKVKIESSPGLKLLKQLKQERYYILQLML